MHPYVPHVVFGLALTSVSMNLVSGRKTWEEQKAKADAQISILESIRDDLKAGKTISDEELARLRKLAQPSENIGTATTASALGNKPTSADTSQTVSWGTIFKGQKPEEGHLSKWDLQDLERRALKCPTFRIFF